jgi:SecD/SecF fusion protein
LLGREVTVDTVAALLTILGYSLYDTIIVFDRVRENIPRMPRAAFSQIVNRSMSEVLTRSIATTSCTLLPIIALLLFGGSTLRDFAFALLIGVASGAYSSIFIASPVLTHWKEREPVYRHRRDRIVADQGFVAPYASAGADIEPAGSRARKRAGRLTEPEAETVSAAEFEQLKRDIAEEEREPTRRTSTLTKRLSHTPEEDADNGGTGAAAGAGSRPSRRAKGRARPPAAPSATAPDATPAPKKPPAPKATPAPPAAATPPPASSPTGPRSGNGTDGSEGGGYNPAPDEAENEGMSPVQKPARPSKSRSRNRRHGRRR